MRIELTSYDAIELTSEELIQSIHNNVFGECVNDDDRIVSGIVKLLKNTLLNNVDGEDYVIDFINWNITSTGEGFSDMLTTEIILQTSSVKSYATTMVQMHTSTHRNWKSSATS